MSDRGLEQDSSGAETPEAPEQLLVRAQADARAGRFDLARAACVAVLSQQPGHAAATGLLGMIAGKTGQLDDARGLLEQAVGAAPRMAALHSALASVYQKLCRPSEALREAMAAVTMQPNNAEFLVGLAMIQTDLDQHEQAKISLLRAIGHNPDASEAHLALAQVLLAQGEMAPGWLEYEWRNRMDVAHNALPRMTSPAWNGMRIPGGRLLLIGDQGYGDTIQFARYIPMVAERCREIVLGCSSELVPLLKDIPGITQCLSRWDAIPPHAAHMRLSGLPLIFGTTPDTIPAKAPYLAADPERMRVWSTRLGLRSNPRVGIAWRGRPTHPNDIRRSVALTQLTPLTTVRPMEFVCLQKAPPASDQPAFASFSGMIDQSDYLQDFSDTAALIASLDLVICVDSAVAHLAGALGRPCWVLLAKAADWRWMLGREDSPWYPSLRLFRQHTPGDWSDVIEAVKIALEEI